MSALGILVYILALSVELASSAAVYIYIIGAGCWIGIPSREFSVGVESWIGILNSKQIYTKESSQPANVAHIHTHRQRRNDTRRDQLKTTLSVPVSTSPSEISSKPRKTIQAKLDKPRPAKSRQNALGGAIHGGGGGTQGAGFSGRLLLTWHCNRTICLGAT